MLDVHFNSPVDPFSPNRTPIFQQKIILQLAKQVFPPYYRSVSHDRRPITLDIIQIVNINPLNAELNPICRLLALLGAHHILHVSRLRVKERCKINAEFFSLQANVTEDSLPEIVTCYTYDHILMPP
jgi:hypothetical protein